MFHTLSNVQRGEAIPLQRCIDNRDGRLSIGLRSITFAVGWYNIEHGETFSWRFTGGSEETLNIPPGLYGFDRLKEVLKGTTHTLAVSRESGLITLEVAPEREIRLSDGLLALLGLDDGLGGVWLDAGVYTSDRPVNLRRGKCCGSISKKLTQPKMSSTGLPQHSWPASGWGATPSGT